MARRNKKGLGGSIGKGVAKFLMLVVILASVGSVYLESNNKKMIGFLETFVKSTDVYKVGEKVYLGAGSIEINNVIISGASDTKVSFDVIVTNGTTAPLYFTYADIGKVLDDRWYYNISTPDASIATILPGYSHTFKLEFERANATQEVYFMTSEKMYGGDDKYQASFDFSDEVTKADGTTYKTKAEMHNEVVGKEKREAIEAERLKNSEAAEEESTDAESEVEVQTEEVVPAEEMLAPDAESGS